MLFKNPAEEEHFYPYIEDISILKFGYDWSQLALLQHQTFPFNRLSAFELKYILQFFSCWIWRWFKDRKRASCCMHVWNRLRHSTHALLSDWRDNIRWWKRRLRRAQAFAGKRIYRLVPHFHEEILPNCPLSPPLWIIWAETRAGCSCIHWVVGNESVQLQVTLLAACWHFSPVLVGRFSCGVFVTPAIGCFCNSRSNI